MVPPTPISHARGLPKRGRLIVTLTFIGGWGGRLETEADTARRMQRSWAEFPQEQGVYTPWSLQLYPNGALKLQPVPAGNLAAIIDAVRLVTEDVNQGPRTAPGASPRFVRELIDSPVAVGGPLFTYFVRCGFAGPRALRNHVLLELDPAAGNPPDANQLVRDYLIALVVAWKPEHLSVCTHAFHKAQGHKTPQVRVGWLTYVRDDVPMDLGVVDAGVNVVVGQGGRYLTLSGTPLDPDIGEALSVRWALGYSA
jgi:hypothetical protein